MVYGRVNALNKAWVCTVGKLDRIFADRLGELFYTFDPVDIPEVFHRWSRKGVFLLD